MKTIFKSLAAFAAVLLILAAVLLIVAAAKAAPGWVIIPLAIPAGAAVCDMLR